MSTQIKRLKQNGQEFVPITLAEAVVVNGNTIWTNEEKITTLDVVLRTLFGKDKNLQDLIDEINTNLANKQDKLSAGQGINIAEDGTISVTLDATLYKIVTSLPESPTVENLNYIYLVPASEVSGNIYKEFICIEKGENYVWEELGTIQTSVDLSGYVTTETFNTRIASIESSMLTATDVTTSGGIKIQVNYSIPNDLYDSAAENTDDNI